MSFFDMIPSEYMMMPAGTHASRRVEKKNFGLLESKCAYCGKTFYRRSHEVQYVRHKNGKKLYFCTWKHTCRWEEETPKEERRTTKGRKRKPTQERIDKLMRDIAKIRAELDSEAGRAMSRDERNRLHSGIGWRVHELKKLLEGIDGEDPGGVRGIAGGDDRAAQVGA